MARRRRERKPLPTIWQVPDDLWKQVEPILEEHDPARRMGRKRGRIGSERTESLLARSVSFAESLLTLHLSGTCRWPRTDGPSPGACA